MPLSLKEEMVQLHYEGNVKPRSEYTVSLSAAMTQHAVVGLQMIEGANDSVLFENFVFKVLAQLRSDPVNEGRKIMVVSDNARIHRQEHMRRIAERLGVDFLFLPQYSPWMNPIEQLFNLLKQQQRTANQSLSR